MRLFTAISWFFRILFRGNAAFAQLPGAADRPTFQGSTEPAVQLLGLFQKEGRLIDFLREDISSYGDADVGAAVRDIHRGCRRVLDAHFQLRPIREEEEGTTVTLPEDFDRSAVELSGQVPEAGPFSGILRHRGWYAAEVKLPTVPESADPKVAAPAQVEAAS